MLILDSGGQEIAAAVSKYGELDFHPGDVRVVAHHQHRAFCPVANHQGYQGQRRVVLHGIQSAALPEEAVVIHTAPGIPVPPPQDVVAVGLTDFELIVAA